MNVLFLRRTSGIFGFLISLWTRSPYTHSELEFTNGERFTSSAGIGTRFLPPLPFTENAKWVRVPVAMTPDEEAAVLLFCDAEVGCKYDWLGIALTQFIGLGRESPTKWFCSEVCTAALQRVLPHFSKTRACRFSPNRLHHALTTLRAFA